MPHLRTRVKQRLLEMDGRHLVWVRYGPTHVVHEEWVYKDAELDESPIVWFRANSEKEVADVMRFFPGRRLWVADVERDSVKVVKHGSSEAVWSWKARPQVDHDQDPRVASAN